MDIDQRMTARFSDEEWQVLQQALAQYEGPFGHKEDKSNLTAEERDRQERMLELADQMRSEVEGFLLDRWRDEQMQERCEERRRIINEVLAIEEQQA